MLVIAHRGANKEALENSWDAFDRAIDGGASRIELDVQLTRDGHAVIMHDDSLQKTTGVMALCSQLTRGELQELKLVNGENLPFLDEALERLLPRVELNIEIKHSSERGEALAGVVGTLLARHPRRGRVIASCFNAAPLVHLARLAPDVQRACLWNLQDTFSWPDLATLAPPVFLARCGTTILHPHASLVTENLMDQAAARGWTVYAWVAMAGEEADREGLWTGLKTLGLHGLCTNYPRQFRSWLEDASIDEHTYREHP